MRTCCCDLPAESVTGRIKLVWNVLVSWTQLELPAAFPAHPPSSVHTFHIHWTLPLHCLSSYQTQVRSVCHTPVPCYFFSTYNSQFASVVRQVVVWALACFVSTLSVCVTWTLVGVKLDFDLWNRLYFVQPAIRSKILHFALIPSLPCDSTSGSSLICDRRVSYF